MARRVSARNAGNQPGQDREEEKGRGRRCQVPERGEDSPGRARSREDGEARTIALPERLQDELQATLKRVENPGPPQRDRFEVGRFPRFSSRSKSSTGTTRGRSACCTA